MPEHFRHNLLAITHNPKGIPYHGGDREGGSTNHGFMNPKSMSQKELISIPEVAGDAAFEYAIPRLNYGRTGYFTVGCEKSHNVAAAERDRPESFWSKGYIEFSFNSAKLVQDASHYFPLFFHFSAHLRERKPTNNHFYLWELSPNIIDSLESAAFSATIWLQTELLQTKEERDRIWLNGWKVLTDFLVGWAGSVPQDAPFIFPCNQDSEKQP